MRIAWAASIAAQALLAASLWRAGRRDWWLAYLVLDLARSAALWGLSGAAYWWAWMLTQPLLIAAQFAAVGNAVQAVRLREVLHIGLISAASMWLWCILLTGDTWPTARRAPLMLFQGASLGCLGVLAAPLAYGAATDKWMLIYFFTQSFYGIVGQITVLGEQWNSLHLWVVSLLYAAWASDKKGVTFWAK